MLFLGTAVYDIHTVPEESGVCFEVSEAHHLFTLLQLTY